MPGNTFAVKYRLLKKIGIRAYAEVWQAVDESTQDTIVALKIYSPERGMDDFSLKLFYKEFAELLRLSHQHLLQVTHFDLWQGFPFLVMPYCSGGSLYQKIVEDGPLSEKDIAVVLMQVGSALAYLHDNGVIHRNIKPDNILLDGKGNYLLSEYGISSRLNSVLRKNSGGDKILSLAYAPPELFGTLQKTTKEGDVFALGVLIYELCTGELPWLGAGGSIMREDTLLPELPSAFSPDLCRLMQHCMQFQPASRPSMANIGAAGKYFIQQGKWPTPYFSGSFSSFGKVEQVSPTAVTQIHGSISDHFEQYGSADEHIQENKEVIIGDESTENALLEEAVEVYQGNKADTLTLENETVAGIKPEEVESPLILAEDSGDIVEKTILYGAVAEYSEGIVDNPTQEELQTEILLEEENVFPSAVDELAREPLIEAKLEDDFSDSEGTPTQEMPKEIPDSANGKSGYRIFWIVASLLMILSVAYWQITKNPPSKVKVVNSAYLVQIRLAEQAMQTGDYRKAVQLYDEALMICTSDCSLAETGKKIASDSIEVVFTRYIAAAEQSLLEKNNEQARFMLKKAETVKPGDSLVLELLQKTDMVQPVKEVKTNTSSIVSSATLKEPAGREYSYTGQLINGLPDGDGEAIYSDGSRYKGQFNDGKQSGQGAMFWADGTQYIGAFYNNRFHGHGVLIFPNGERSEGLFRNGEKVK